MALHNYDTRSEVIRGILDALSFESLDQAIDKPIAAFRNEWSVEVVPTTGSDLVSELIRFYEPLSTVWLGAAQSSRGDRSMVRHHILTALDKKGDHIDIIIEGLAGGMQGVDRVIDVLVECEKDCATEYHVIRAFPWGWQDDLSPEESELLAREYLSRFCPLVPDGFLPNDWEALRDRGAIMVKHIELARMVREVNGGRLITCAAASACGCACEAAP